MSGKRKQADENSGLADRLHSSAILLLRKLRGEDRDSGLGPARLSALSVLVHGGEMTLGELAAAEQVRPPTMSVTVKTLQQAGLVKIRPDRDDARQRNITATTRGRVVLGNARDRRVKRLTDAISKLPQARRQHLVIAINDLEQMIKELET